MVDEQAKAIIQECINFSRYFMYITDDLCICIEDYSDNLFLHKNVPCFTTATGDSIVFNRNWLRRELEELSEEIDLVDDVRFFVFHELRHVYQKYQIKRLENKESIRESFETVSQWRKDFENYKTNFGDNESQEDNLRQEVEIDANAYAIALLNMFHLRDKSNWRYNYSLPEKAYRMADKRSKEYYSTQPALRHFIDCYIKEINGKPKQNTKKPGRNDSCPCGSGKKFKKCCLGNGKYD